MADCPRCGTPASSRDRFCRECGGYLPQTSFDDLEPQDPTRQHEPTNYGDGGPVEFSGPAVPAIDESQPAQPAENQPGQTMEGGWAQPATWHAEAGDQPLGEQHPSYGDPAVHWTPSPPPYDGPTQYPAPQYDNQQPYQEPPPYDPGGYGPPPQYESLPPGDGPVPFDESPYQAPPFGQNGDRPPRKKSNAGLVIGGVVLAVVLVLALIGGGAFLFLHGNGNGDDRAGSSQSPAAKTGGVTPTPSKSQTPQQQADAVDGLLSKATTGKSMLSTAYDQANACEISPSEAEQKFRTAAQNRRSIVRSARKLDTSRLDNGPQIKSLMTSMYSTSAKADDAFADWAKDGVDNADTCLSGNAKRTKGNDLSVKAGDTKKKFVKKWNPVAEQFGLSKRTKDGL